jgi:diphthamide biosynthesis methyltransferase
MKGEEGLKILLEANILSGDEKVIVASCLGTRERRVKYGEVGKLISEDFPSPCVIVVPGKLHFREKEFLKMIEG